jgi:hypothetical protein
MLVIVFATVLASFGIAVLGRWLAPVFPSGLAAQGATGLIMLASVWLVLAVTFEIGGSVRTQIATYDYAPRRQPDPMTLRRGRREAWLTAVVVAVGLGGAGWLVGWACAAILGAPAARWIGGAYSGLALICLPLNARALIRLTRELATVRR